MINIYLENKLPIITTICQKYKVKKLYAFGSIVDGRFVEGKSDIDLLVELRPRSAEEKARTLLKLWIDFQNALNCEVDLITPNCVRGKYFKKYLEFYKELIFDYKIVEN